MKCSKCHGSSFRERGDGTAECNRCGQVVDLDEQQIEASLDAIERVRTRRGTAKKAREQLREILRDAMQEAVSNEAEIQARIDAAVAEAIATERAQVAAILEPVQQAVGDLLAKLRSPTNAVAKVVQVLSGAFSDGLKTTSQEAYRAGAKAAFAQAIQIVEKHESAKPKPRGWY